MSPPVGPTGLAQRCSGKAHDDEGAPRWRLGATFSAFRTTLVFDERWLSFEQLATSASLELRLSTRWTLSFAGGGVYLGSLGASRTGAGGVASVGASFLAVEQGRFTPFVMLSGSVAASLLPTARSLYGAVDLRAGVAVGYTFLQRVTPYLVGRVFGGPVFYDGLVGTDLYHYQAGLGLVVGLPWGLDLSAELVPFGEQRLTAGLGFSF